MSSASAIVTEENRDFIYKARMFYEKMNGKKEEVQKSYQENIVETGISSDIEEKIDIVNKKIQELRFQAKQTKNKSPSGFSAWAKCFLKPNYSSVGRTASSLSISSGVRSASFASAYS